MVGPLTDAGGATWTLGWLTSESPEDTRKIEQLAIWGRWPLERLRFQNILEKLGNCKTVTYYDICGREEEDDGSEDMIDRTLSRI
jgi:hypothetical protein